MPERAARYTIDTIQTVIGGQRITGPAEADELRELLIDSRRLLTPRHTLFFAIASTRNDGHLYIEELFKKGVRNFIVSRIPDVLPSLDGSNILLVDDTIAALQTLTAHHRRRFDFPVIGITGSNGKTIVKEWLFQLLGKERHIVRSPKSYNSQIGVPLSVWQMEPGHELGIIEAGISMPGEMEKLEPIIRPDIGIFTNIGQAHDENFTGQQQKIEEKLKLFPHVRILIFCTDHEPVARAIREDRLLREKTTFTWGHLDGSDLRIESVKSGNTFTSISGSCNGLPVDITIPFSDGASVENAIFCWAVMLYLNYDHNIIRERMGTLAPIAMRMEMKEGINHCSVLNDSYSADVKSLNIALDFLDQQKQHTRKTVILSDFLQSGRDDTDLYSEIAVMLENKHVDRIIGIGPHISRQSLLFRMEKDFYPDTDQFIQAFPALSFQHEAILLKGARIFQFEKINTLLQQKAHETVLEINLDALVYNLNYLRSKLLPSTHIMVMVKAFSYGSGSYEIANLLQYHRTGYLAVAYADEGYELRKAGISLPIMVMNPEEESMAGMIRHHLEPEVYSFRVLDIVEEGIRSGNGNLTEPVMIHIKLDTGMHRLGFEEKDLDALAERVKANPHISVRSVFSHLAAAEEGVHDPFTLGQIDCFSQMCDRLGKLLGQPFLRHILNSAGISRFPGAQFEMVRLGISLYGIPACPAQEGKLQHVSTLRSVVSQIKHIPASETIGYNRKWKAETDMTIAIVPIGYADGLSRRLSNGKGKLLVNGQFARIVGNICMDMCTVDITGMQVKEGDEVTVFGKNYPITELARDMGTIPYEVLTGISRRVKRVYYQE
jgi:alanine racemase